MFLKTINEFKNTFHILNNLNMILFANWKDQSAEAYKQGELMLIQTTYTKYIEEMSEISNELERLQKDMDELSDEIDKSLKEISEIRDHPEIEGCSLYKVTGCDGYDEDDKPINERDEFFAVNRHYERPEDEMYARTDFEYVDKSSLYLVAPL